MFVNQVGGAMPPPAPHINYGQSGPKSSDSIYTFWHLQNVTSATREWIQKAQQNQVDIQKQTNKLIRVMLDAPPIYDENRQIKEVTLVQQIMMRNFYCNQIIRQVTKQQICKTATLGRCTPELAKYLNLINGNEKSLLNQLPPKRSLLCYKVSERQCLAIENRLESFIELFLSLSKKKQRS